MSKTIEERRERKMEEAASNNDWDTLLKLLDQPLKNLERKDRAYHLSSLNTEILSDELKSEVIDFYPDNTYNPIDQLLIKECNEYLGCALSKLPEVERYIFIEIALYGTSALQLTKKTHFKSHKTIQSHYKYTCKILKDELKKYF